MSNTYSDGRLVLSFEPSKPDELDFEDHTGSYVIRHGDSGKLEYRFEVIEDGDYFQIYTSSSEVNRGSSYPGSIKDNSLDSHDLAKRYAREKIKDLSEKLGVGYLDNLVEVDKDDVALAS